jgi:hypothetical protein
MLRCIADDREQNHTNELLANRSGFSQSINRVDEEFRSDSDQLEKTLRSCRYNRRKHVPPLRRSKAQCTLRRSSVAAQERSPLWSWADCHFPHRGWRLRRGIEMGLRLPPLMKPFRHPQDSHGCASCTTGRDSRHRSP